MSLNRNNFLRWTGTSTKRSYTITPVASTFHLFANKDSVVTQPLSLCTASLGINLLSFNIYKILDDSGSPVALSQDCEYDGDGNLTVYRPIDLTVTDFIIFFTFDDNSGNQNSSTAIMEIVVDTVTVSWVVYPVSQVCLLDSFGNNTGYSNFTQLKLQNNISHTDISPLQLKPNVVSDPDYIAPVTDYITCPNIAASYAPLFLSNFTQNGADLSTLDTITITNLYLYSATGSITGGPITLNINCNIPNGVTQRFNVPAIAWDSISISYTVQAGGNMVTASPQRYWKSQFAGVVQGFGSGGSSLTSNPVINTSPFSGVGITVPLNSSGITVFAS